MDDSTLDLPGDFEAGKNHLIKGETMLTWKKSLKADRAIPGHGLFETATPNGRVFRVVFPPSAYPPFALKEAEVDGSNYKLLFEPGRVIVANPVSSATGADGYDYFIPEIDGVAMDEELPAGGLPTLSISDGQAVYVKVNRDDKGVVIPPVQLVADEQEKESDHYQPENPDEDGEESEHDFIRILDLDLENGELVIKPWRESDIDLTPFLWTGKNVGEGQRVFKEHARTEGTYEFRSIRGCWGIQATEDGDSIKIESHGINTGDGESYSDGEGANLLIEQDAEDPDVDLCEEPFKIKALVQGSASDQKQIEIHDDGDFARITGNGKNGSIVFNDCAGNLITSIEWEDGLITSSGVTAMTVGDCSDNSSSS